MPPSSKRLRISPPQTASSASGASLDTETTTSPTSSAQAAIDAALAGYRSEESSNLPALLSLMRTLLERGQFAVYRPTFADPTTIFRIAELELYYHHHHGPNVGSEIHCDPFVHCDERQLYGGGLYFHRCGTGDHAYKGGSYKGLDITVGSAGTDPANSSSSYVGLLVRSVTATSEMESSSIDPDDSSMMTHKEDLIEGPCRVVDALLQAAGVSSIQSYVTGLADDQLLAAHIPKACASRRGEATTISLELAPMNPERRREESILATARVGLSLKKLSSSTPKEEIDACFHYILSPYRFLRSPSTLQYSKGRVSIVLAPEVTLREEEDDKDHWKETITNRTGIAKSLVNKYVDFAAEGRQQRTTGSRQHFLGRSNLTVRQLCRMHGILWGTIQGQYRINVHSLLTDTASMSGEW